MEIMSDPRRTDPKQMEMQNKLYAEWKKALRQYWFSLDFKKAGGQKQWSVIAIYPSGSWSDASRTSVPIHHLMGPSFLLD